MAGDHKCLVCNATFTRPQHVARHMRSRPSSSLSPFLSLTHSPPTDTGDRPYKCQHCGDQFARSDLLSRHVNKCHSSEKPASSPNNRRKGSTSATRATTSKQACDQCVITNLPCDGSNPCGKSSLSLYPRKTQANDPSSLSSEMHLSQVPLHFCKIPSSDRPHRARSPCPSSPQRQTAKPQSDLLSRPHPPLRGVSAKQPKQRIHHPTRSQRRSYLSSSPFRHPSPIRFLLLRKCPLPFVRTSPFRFRLFCSLSSPGRVSSPYRRN